MALRRATVAGFAKSAGVKVDERLIVDALEVLRAQGWLASSGRSAAEPLPRSDADFLDAHGGVKDNREALLQERVAARLRRQRLVEDTLNVDQVADLLGVSTSRVRHRISDGSLYCFPSEGRGVARRIPAWQFEQGDAIPHLAHVLAGLPDDFSPVEVRDFAVNAKVDHPTRGTQVPLLQWLLDGGDPAPAVELAAAQDQVA